MDTKSSQKISLSLLQMEVFTRSPQKNLATAARLLDRLQRTAGALQVSVLPEMALTGFTYRDAAELAGQAEEITARAGEFARQHNTDLVFTLPWPVKQRVTNRLVYIDSTGEITASYDKIHLINFGGFAEADFYYAGSDRVVIERAGFRIGLAVCYDLRFPELFREMGADLILLPSQWPNARAVHLNALARARAIENQCWFAVVNTIGRQGRLHFNGESSLYRFDGQFDSLGSEKEGRLDTVLDLEELQHYRRELPVLADRRFYCESE